MMRIYLFGPTGDAWQELLKQAIDRDFDVIAAKRSSDEDPAPQLQYERQIANVLDEGPSGLIEVFPPD